MTESKHVPSILVRPMGRSLVVTVSFSVAGAPNMPAQYSGKPFRPESITVKIQDTQWTLVNVVGRRVLLSGGLGASARKAWYGPTDLEKDAPAWVKDTLAEVLRTEGAR
jgi:hypothetical protein